MKPYTAPALSPQRTIQVEQGLFDFLVPFKSLLLRPDQVAQCLRGITKSGNVSLNYVYCLKEEGKLECLAPTGREKERFVVTRRSVLLLIAEQANFDPSDFDTKLEALLPSLTRAQLDRLIIKATQLRAKL